MDENLQPLDADELMGFSERVDRLPEDTAAWVGRLLQECLRARTHEAELLEQQALHGSAKADQEISDAQLAQLTLDAAEWLRTLWEVGYMGAGNFPAPPRSAFPTISLDDVLNSSLFARIREGKRPLPFAPPTRNGLPWHDLIEGDDEAHVVHAEAISDAAGRAISTIVEGCADWKVVDLSDRAGEYVIQYRGRGPLFRLSITPYFSTLKREQAVWTRRIVERERSGTHHYFLLWPADNPSGIQEIPLPAANWERAESEAAYWVATNHPEMYGQIRFERGLSD